MDIDFDLLEKGLNNEKRTYNSHDSKAKAEEKTVNKDIREEANVARIISNTTLRINTTYSFISIISFWLIAVIYILIGNYHKYHITDNVLITLLTTTTLNIIAMMIIILKGLFPNTSKPNKS
jgi:hypothetical protein